MTSIASRAIAPRVASFAVARGIMAVLGAAAIVVQLGSSIEYWRGLGIHDLTVNVVNFFSFFTIDSNILATVVCAIGAVLLVVRGPDAPRWFVALRAAAVSYMFLTGVVYNLLLRNIALPQGVTVAWSNEVLHLVFPLYLVVDWILAPDARRLSWGAVGGILVFPAIWIAYTLLRGPHVSDPATGATHWYPYPFLNPYTSAGYAMVAGYVVVIAVAVAVIAAAVVLVGRRRGGS